MSPRELRFRNKASTSPSDVFNGDAFAIKVVAVAYHPHEWAAYQGPSDWSDQLVAESGDKLDERDASALFFVMRHTKRSYRH